MSLYLDNSATTKVCPEAAEAATDAMTVNFGNPSSTHKTGIRAKTVLEQSRKSVADRMGVSADEIYFSHSGTLANNTAIFGAVKAKKNRGSRIVTTSLEHPSVARVMDELENEGYEVIRLSPTENGSFSAEEMANAVNDKTILVSTMYVNNETGAINPVECIKKIVDAAKSPALIHVDAIQAFGKIDVRPKKLGVDFVSVSGHKIHAPKGIGALYIRKGVNIRPFVLGGGQENGLFSGTENMPAIAGLGAAVNALPDTKKQLGVMRELNAYLRSELVKIPGVEINSPENGLPYILNISLVGIPSQVAVNFLSDKEIYVSSGSACKRGHRSEVLTAMGLAPERIDSAIRVSMSRFTTKDELQVFVSAVNDAVNTLRRK